MNNNDRATDFALQALKIYRSIHDTLQITAALNFIAMSSLNSEKALEYQRQIKLILDQNKI